MKIRLIDEHEVKLIQQLAEEIWPITFAEILSKEQIRYMLNWMYNPDTLSNQIQQGHEFYLLSNNAENFGFLGLQPHFPSKNQSKVHKLYVKPAMHGFGLGKQLMIFAQQRAVACKTDELVLNVNRFNKAVDFYLKLGFEIIKTEDIDIGQGYLMEDFVMMKRLSLV